jgi:hypothetical protein
MVVTMAANSRRLAWISVSGHWLMLQPTGGPDLSSRPAPAVLDDAFAFGNSSSLHMATHVPVTVVRIDHRKPHDGGGSGGGCGRSYRLPRSGGRQTTRTRLRHDERRLHSSFRKPRRFCVSTSAKVLARRNKLETR